jgi:hypothetical protein
MPLVFIASRNMAIIWARSRKFSATAGSSSMALKISSCTVFMVTPSAGFRFGTRPRVGQHPGTPPVQRPADKRHWFHGEYIQFFYMIGQAG